VYVPPLMLETKFHIHTEPNRSFSIKIAYLREYCCRPDQILRVLQACSYYRKARMYCYRPRQTLLQLQACSSCSKPRKLGAPLDTVFYIRVPKMCNHSDFNNSQPSR
jgi:hypothetical protein